jgi:hypothetical protein
MAKKKGAIGTITFFKETSKKRPLRHSKKYNKRISKRKSYRGQGR